METLEELRVRLDEIDDQIVNLYEQRMEICAHVRQGKRCWTDREKKRNWRT